MSASQPFKWTPSRNLPAKPPSFAGVGYDEMLQRARSLLPAFAERAAQCEKARQLIDENERDLHRTGLFRVLQPARVGGAELDLGIIVEVCAELAKVCPSSSWNFGNLASHHWMLAYYEPETQDEIWDVSPDTLIATSLAFPGGRGRKVDGGWEVSGRWPLSSGIDNSDWNMLGFQVRDQEDGPVVDNRFALVHRSEYEIIDTWHAMGLAGTGSKHVACSKLFVPDRRSLSAWAFNGKPHAGSKLNPGPLFRLPGGDAGSARWRAPWPAGRRWRPRCRWFRAGAGGGSRRPIPAGSCPGSTRRRRPGSSPPSWLRQSGWAHTPPVQWARRG